jgi:hypothetical protein
MFCPTELQEYQRSRGSRLERSIGNRVWRRIDPYSPETSAGGTTQ